MLVALLFLALVPFAALLYPSWSSCCSDPVPAPSCTAWPWSGARGAVVCLARLGRFPPLLGLRSAVPGGNPGSSWASGSARPRAVRAGGRWGCRLGPGCGGSPVCSAAGPRLRRDGGDVSVRGRAGRAGGAGAAWQLAHCCAPSRSARLPACLPGGRERAACLSSILAQRAGSCQPRACRGSRGARERCWQPVLPGTCPCGGSGMVSVGAPGCP